MGRSMVAINLRALPLRRLGGSPSRSWRCLSSSSGLKEALTAMMPEKKAALTKFKKEHGTKIVDKVTIDQLIGGARSIKCMLWETSLLDSLEGIRFRGYTIPELQEKLPTAIEGGEPLPEGLLWLLLTARCLPRSRPPH